MAPRTDVEQRGRQSDPPSSAAAQVAHREREVLGLRLRDPQEGQLLKEGQEVGGERAELTVGGTPLELLIEASRDGDVHQVRGHQRARPDQVELGVVGHSEQLPLALVDQVGAHRRLGVGAASVGRGDPWADHQPLVDGQDRPGEVTQVEVGRHAEQLLLTNEHEDRGDLRLESLLDLVLRVELAQNGRLDRGHLQGVGDLVAAEVVQRDGRTRPRRLDVVETRVRALPVELQPDRLRG